MARRISDEQLAMVAKDSFTVTPARAQAMANELIEARKLAIEAAVAISPNGAVGLDLCLKLVVLLTEGREVPRVAGKP